MRSCTATTGWRWDDRRLPIADCAVYPYVVLSPKDGVELESYSQVARGMTQMEELPGFLPKP